jgi:hypothetical protein
MKHSKLKFKKKTFVAWNTIWMKNSWMLYAHYLITQENVPMGTLSQKVNVAHNSKFHFQLREKKGKRIGSIASPEM